MGVWLLFGKKKVDSMNYNYRITGETYCCKMITFVGVESEMSAQDNEEKKVGNERLKTVGLGETGGRKKRGRPDGCQLLETSFLQLSVGIKGLESSM